jgi:hypothetical protein
LPPDTPRPPGTRPAGAGGPLLEEEPALQVSDSDVVALVEAALKLPGAKPAIKE